MTEQYTVHQIFNKRIQVQNNTFNSKDNIVMLTFDDNYIDQSINLILSIAKHNPSHVSFVCTCPVLSQKNIDLLLNLEPGIQIQCYEFALDLQMGRWALSAVLRLFSPWLLDETISRVLYMDSDILCCGSLKELFQTDVRCIAMCNEISGNVSLIQQGNVRPYVPTRIYCNSGVVLFNLDYLRKNHTFHEIYTALNEINGKVVYLDQDFLNIYFQGKIDVLNAFHYNFQAYELKDTVFYKNALRNCRLIHFSVGKPWLYKTKLCYIQLYLKHSLYPPMISRVKKTFWKSLAYSPIRTARHILSPIKQAIISVKNKK